MEKVFLKKTKNVAVISQKGGVGKSTIAINTALGLRDKYHYEVGLLDLDIDDPNDRIYLSTELDDHGGLDVGNISSILTKPEGKLEEGELRKIIRKGRLAELVYANMTSTKHPTIHTLFSDLSSKVNKKEVYKQVFSIFNRISRHKPKDGNLKTDFLFCDFPTGSMSDPNVAELMKYFDYRILVITLDPVCIDGIYTAMKNDEKGEFVRPDATNILVTNMIPGEVFETLNLPFVSKLEGRGMSEAKILNQEIRRDLRYRLRIDYEARILNFPVIDQRRYSTKTLRPAILERKTRFCESIDALTDCIVDDAIKKEYLGGLKNG